VGGSQFNRIIIVQRGDTDWGIASSGEKRVEVVAM
jgi:hypothetical protein